MVDADQFVSGTSVRVRLLVGTLVGGVLVTVWLRLAELVDAVGQWVSLSVTRIGVRVEEIVVTYFSVTEGWWVAWEAAGEFVTGLPIGPLVFPLAAVLVAGWFVVLERGIRAMGVV